MEIKGASSNVWHGRLVHVREEKTTIPISSNDESRATFEVASGRRLYLWTKYLCMYVRIHSRDDSAPIASTSQVVVENPPSSVAEATIPTSGLDRATVGLPTVDLPTEDLQGLTLNTEDPAHIPRDSLREESPVGKGSAIRQALSGPSVEQDNGPGGA